MAKMEADTATFPDLLTVPGFRMWLGVVQRVVMGGSLIPIDRLKWWDMICTATLEEMADSGELFRWD